ncbi:hypothetical protein U9D55_003893 [Enterobacter roggenkampii]|jgi:hypothetical protein|nr:hypothetical protein [Enterobacter asburiae]EMB4295554.1 hypothetical protein [Enterobacter roggenkampii]
MDEKEVTFPLSYEQMTSAAEEEITRLLKNQDTATLLNRWEQASGVQTFWNNLAINFYEAKDAAQRNRISEDGRRLQRLLGLRPAGKNSL